MSEPPHTILIVDDEPSQRELLGGFLQRLGYRVIEAVSGEQAIESVRQSLPDLVLLDVRLPGIDGIETLRLVRQKHQQLPVMLITAFADLRQAVEAMKGGAEDYLTKPVDLDELKVAIEDSLRIGPQFGANNSIPLPPIPKDFIAESPVMRRLLSTIAMVAPSNAPVLITGESGTGKDVVARLLHSWSPRLDGPMIAANCASLPESLIESELFGHTRGAFTGASEVRQGFFRAANQGTLFLDEIAEMPIHLQPKLLRALETGSVVPVGSDEPFQVDIRLIAATNRDLETEIAEGRFRGDLYYRINVVEITMAPLRERREDILPLARHLATEFSGGPIRLSPQAMNSLLAYPWPGNVRELRNAMQRACLLSRGDIILPEHLPPKLAGLATQAAEPLQDSNRLSQVERATIIATLQECDGNRTKTAQKLGISRRALIYKLQAIETKVESHNSDL